MIKGFPEWIKQNEEWMAAAFAKCDNPKAIHQVLRKLNSLWEAELERTLHADSDNRDLARLVNNLIEQ